MRERLRRPVDAVALYVAVALMWLIPDVDSKPASGRHDPPFLSLSEPA